MELFVHCINPRCPNKLTHKVPKFVYNMSKNLATVLCGRCHCPMSPVPGSSCSQAYPHPPSRPDKAAGAHGHLQLTTHAHSHQQISPRAAVTAVTASSAHPSAKRAKQGVCVAPRAMGGEINEGGAHVDGRWRKESQQSWKCAVPGCTNTNRQNRHNSNIPGVIGKICHNCYQVQCRTLCKETLHAECIVPDCIRTYSTAWYKSKIPGVEGYICQACYLKQWRWRKGKKSNPAPSHNFYQRLPHQVDAPDFAQSS